MLCIGAIRSESNIFYYSSVSVIKRAHNISVRRGQTKNAILIISRGRTNEPTSGRRDWFRWKKNVSTHISHDCVQIWYVCYARRASTYTLIVGKDGVLICTAIHESIERMHVCFCVRALMETGYRCLWFINWVWLISQLGKTCATLRAVRDIHIARPEKQAFGMRARMNLLPVSFDCPASGCH